MQPSSRPVASETRRQRDVQGAAIIASMAVPAEASVAQPGDVIADATRTLDRHGRQPQSQQPFPA
jgi:hypothetical protein